VTYCLAGDATYTQELLLRREVDGVTMRPGLALQTVKRLLAYARSHPMVYLPSHDPGSKRRLVHKLTLVGENRSMERELVKDLTEHA
jgi:hypothetical protein